MKFRVALAQIDPVLGDLARNVDIHCSFVSRALEGGADIVVFPELSLTGYTVKDMNLGLAIRTEHPPSVLQPLLDLSSSISILAGGIEEDSSFRLYNAAFLLEGGGISGVHRKVYPPTYGMFEELRYFSPGTSVRPFQSKCGVLGSLICEDLWHLPLPYLLAQQGAHVIVTMVASPTRVSAGSDELKVAVANAENHRTLARLLSSYIIFCNRVGFEDGLNFWGSSEVVSPAGEVLVCAQQFEEDMVFATIDEQEIRRARQLSRHFLDDDPLFFLREMKRISREGR